jgi:hypothetical protein
MFRFLNAGTRKSGSPETVEAQLPSHRQPTLAGMAETAGLSPAMAGFRSTRIINSGEVGGTSPNWKSGDEGNHVTKT